MDAVADDMGIGSRMRYQYSPEGAARMFAQERVSRKRFFDRLATQGKSIIKDKRFDYFESEEESGEEPETARDKIGDTSSPSDSLEAEGKEWQEAGQEQVSSEDNETAEGPERPKTFLGKIMNGIRAMICPKNDFLKVWKR